MSVSPARLYCLQENRELQVISLNFGSLAIGSLLMVFAAEIDGLPRGRQ